MNSTREESSEFMLPLAGAIADHRFAAEMNSDHRQKLADAAMFKHFERDEVVFTEGEPANRFYLISRGKIAIESKTQAGATALLQSVGAGEVVGWSWLFPPYYWHFSARAVEPTSAIFFYGTRLREQCDKDPAFGYELMKRIAAIVIQRLQITRTQLLQWPQNSSGSDSFVAGI